MADIADTAAAFFEACETGRGWAACQVHCAPDAGFSSQAEPLAEMRTLEAYTEWMKWLLQPLPDGRYDIKSFAVDPARNTISVFAVFSGTHTADGGPVPPTGRAVEADYVYVMQFTDGRISHMTKVWNAGWSVRELGWA